MPGPEGWGDDPVSVEFDLTPEEWVDVAVRHNLESPVFRSAIRRSMAAFGGIVVLLGLLGFMAGYGSLTLLWLFLGTIGLMVLPRHLERTQRKQYEEIAQGGITNGMFGTHRVHLLDAGLMDDTDAYQRLTRWHAVERVVDGPGAFMIYFGSDAFLPIPHSAFRDSGSLRGFSDRFFSLVGSAGRLPPEVDPPTASRHRSGTSNTDGADGA